MILALSVGVLVAAGVYLILQRDMMRIVIGFGLISHGINLTVLATGVLDRRQAPLLQYTGIAAAADPLPQSFVLTAIVISMAVSVFMLVLAIIGTTDDTQATPDSGTESDEV